jgi:hypothetical protein
MNNNSNNSNQSNINLNVIVLSGSQFRLYVVVADGKRENEVVSVSRPA